MRRGKRRKKELGVCCTPFCTRTTRALKRPSSFQLPASGRRVYRPQVSLEVELLPHVAHMGQKQAAGRHRVGLCFSRGVRSKAFSQFISFLRVPTPSSNVLLCTLKTIEVATYFCADTAGVKTSQTRPLHSRRLTIA